MRWAGDGCDGCDGAMSEVFVELACELEGEGAPDINHAVLSAHKQLSGVDGGADGGDGGSVAREDLHWLVRLSVHVDVLVGSSDVQVREGVGNRVKDVFCNDCAQTLPGRNFPLNGSLVRGARKCIKAIRRE